MRVGIGYDVHKLTNGRELILGGVTIPYDKGLLGHSDADVLVHSIMDALLGAIGAGDIGKHFPDSSVEFKGISSLILLEKVNCLIKEKNYTILNIDCTVVAEKPKLTPFIGEMKKNIARTLEISAESVNIKATTTEGLGFEGLGLGIGAHVVVLLS